MNAPQQQQTEGASAPSTPEPAAKPAKVVIPRMDKSRDFSTVHGDMNPGNPDAAVNFVQDGLPFNAAGRLILDHHTILESEKLQAKVEKLLVKAQKAAAANPGDELDDDEIERLESELDDDDEDGDEPEIVNLVSWAAGQKEYPWQHVTDRIAAKHGRRATNKKQAIEILLEEKVIAIGALSKKHRKLVQD